MITATSAGNGDDDVPVARRAASSNGVKDACVRTWKHPRFIREQFYRTPVYEGKTESLHTVYIAAQESAAGEESAFITSGID